MNVVKILLITGWGGGTQLLSALKQNLEQHADQVELINIFNILDPEVLQKHVQQAQAFDVIMGWSLGGQLATILVNQIQQQYQQHKILITLGSNPCFVQNSDWQYAMSESTFEQFKMSFYADAITTLKKFGFMVCQGVQTAKEDFKKLQSLIRAQNIELLKQGLDELEQLNNVNILKQYTGNQYHIFSKQDYLVSYKIAEKLQNLDAKFLEVDLIHGSHGFPLFFAEEVSCKIFQYLKKIQQRSE